MKIAIRIFVLFMSLAALAQSTKIMGIVFEDIDKDLKWSRNDKALSGILLSNGQEIIATKPGGKYEITLNPSQTLFVIKPSHYQTPTDVGGIATTYIHYYPHPTSNLPYPAMPESPAPTGVVDFPLWPQTESDTFKVAMLGDLQMRIQEEINYANRLLTPEIYKRDDLSFAVLLGDIADDNLHILNGSRQITKHFGMPTYPVFGNHDRNVATDLPNDFTITFKRTFGPDYYSFNYGNVHFIAINDIIPNENGYRGGLTQRQLTFIKNDLSYVDKDRLVVFLQHIPLYTLENLEDLLAIIADRPHVLAVSAHRHILEQEFISYGEKHELHEVIAGAVGGLWWDGERDWKGVPVSVMGGGAPKGYYLFSFQNNAYKMLYKALELPEDKQINIWVWEEERGDPGVIVPAGFNGNEVLVNVFAGSKKTNVTMRVNDGAWQSISKTTDQDPYIARLIRLDSLGIYPTQGQHKSYLKTEPSEHIWRGYLPENLSKGSHKIEVRASDKYGLNAYEVRFFTIGKFDE